MGTDSHFHYIAAHEFSNNLWSGMAKALPVFDTFTGCDTVSCLPGEAIKRNHEPLARVIAQTLPVFDIKLAFTFYIF